MIAVVDTGGANLASVGNALTRLGQEYVVTGDPGVIEGAPHVILPGVGAAADSMQRLEDSGLVECLRALEQPCLGICLGMQLLFDGSEEGDVDCLGIMPGKVERMQPSEGYRIPHMGWNRVVASVDNRLLPEPGWFYFVHSYRAPSGPFVTAAADHAGSVPAIVQQDNFVGCQFHPERSGRDGAALLERFLDL